MSDMDKILEGLLRQTSDRKLRWNRSVTGNEFITAINEISVVVRDLNERRIFGSGHNQLAVLDDEDNTVAVLETGVKHSYVAPDRCATPEQAAQLAQLYELARRSALNTEATLEKLAKALEA